MTFDEYQEHTNKTAVYPKEYGVVYTLIGLVNESGEAVGKLKKMIRGDFGKIDINNPPDEVKEILVDEIMDTVWYAAQALHMLGYSFNDGAQMNLDKLFDRKKRGVIKGSGDKR